MKTTMMMAFVALMSFGAYAQHDHAKHDQKTDQSAIKFKDDKL